MALGGRGAVAQHSHPGSPFSLPFLVRRAGVTLSLPFERLSGYNLSATSQPARKKVQPLDRSVLAAGFGEEGEGGGEGWSSEGEGRERREEGAAADLANCELPSLPKVWSRSAGERSVASSASKLQVSAGLGATSSSARRNPLPIGFTLTFFHSSLSFSFPPLFFLNKIFSWLWTSDCCSLSLPRAQLFGAFHPSGCEKGHAPGVGRRKEEKLVGGVSPVHSNPSRKPKPPSGPSQD